MNFKEWLKNKSALVEAESGRMRSKSNDLTNVSIGKLGPYGTFGSPNIKSPTHDAISGFLGGIGQGISRKLSPVEPLSNVLDPFEKFEFKEISHDTMLLQLPTIDGQRIFSVGANSRQNFNSVISKVVDPNSDPRVRKNPNESAEGKFQLYDDNYKGDQAAIMAAKDEAVNFTTALQKIKIYNKAMAKNPKIDEIYDFQNPTISQYSTELVKFGGRDYYYLATVFNYKKKKSARNDQENGGVE
jgi:hypothetical protein